VFTAGGTAIDLRGGGARFATQRFVMSA